MNPPDELVHPSENEIPSNSNNLLMQINSYSPFNNPL